MTEKLKDIISKATLLPIQQNESVDRSNYNKSDLYVNKKVHKLNHSESQTFFTQEYMDTLNRTLGSPEEFAKRTPYEKKLIQESLSYLNHDDYSLKSYLHSSVNKSDGFEKLFPDEFKRFEKLVEELHDRVYEGQRGYLNRGSYKYAQLMKCVRELLSDEGLDLDIIDEFTEEDGREVLANVLTPKSIFNKILSILVKIARDRMFSKTKTTLEHKALFVFNHEAVPRILDHLILVCVIDAIVYKITSKKQVKPVDQITRVVRVQLASSMKQFSAKRETKLMKDYFKSIFECFIHGGLHSEAETIREGNKTLIKYYLPSKLTSELGKYTVTPRITKPENVTQKELNHYIIPSLSTSTKIVPSEDLIRSINISNGKRFAISVPYLSILNDLEGYDINSEFQPIPSKSQLKRLEITEKNLDKGTNKTQMVLINSIQKKLSNDKLILETPFQLRHTANISIAESRLAAKKHAVTLELADKALSRKAGLTRVTLSRKLQGFPLYYTNKLSSTTRQFAHEYLLSRHIGCLKLLRCEYKPKRTSTEGLVFMLKAYYCNEKDKQNKLDHFLKKNSPSFKNIEAFYESNRLDYGQNESLTHFMLLSAEIQKVLITKKTSVLLQLDQVASGLVFISILFKNVKLGKQCSVIKNLHTVGPYNYAKDSFEDFYNSKIEEKNDKLLHMMSNDKKIHKYALMCYSYNQTTFGRTDDFCNRWLEYYGVSPTSTEWKSISEVSRKYTDFIEEMFPGLNSQKQILDEIIQIVAKNSGSLRIKTLDGSIIEWTYYKTKTETRKAINPVLQTSDSYKLHSLRYENGQLVVDHKQYLVKFLSYLIHSLDASIMRILVVRMFENHGYRIDQLHDCIMSHPNFIDKIYKELEHIYNSKELHNYLKDNVFKTFLDSVSEDVKDKLHTLIGEFNALNDPSFESALDIDIESMYTFED